MKTTKIIAALVALSLLPALGYAQNTPPAPPAPPTQPVPPIPPVPPDRHDRGPKVPVTYIGVETSELPNVVADQLGLPKGFGLVVDYVVPEGPAAAGGVQPNDILKKLNDQILTDPGQLAKLVRSFPEGTNVTLTVLRKGAETTLTVKLAKREVPQRRGMSPRDFGFKWKSGADAGDLTEQMQNLKEELGQMDFHGMLGDLSEATREQIRDAERQAREGAREASRAAREQAREAQRAARDASRQFRVMQRENGGLKTTRIDMNKAQIVYHDSAGELKLENVAGKKLLTAKDSEGRTVFSGPVETKEELDKLPAEVRQRYEKLEQKDLPALTPNVTKGEENLEVEEEDNDADEDDDDDNDSEVTAAVLQVSHCPGRAAAPFRRFAVRTVLI